MTKTEFSQASFGVSTSTYDSVAGEYYDPVRHPTCANFSELSNAYLISRIEKYVSGHENILEVGAGRSTVAPVLERQGLPFERLTLLDQSAGMLEYSRQWVLRGARPVIGDARRTNLPAAGFGLIVSALGDPYNCVAFWKEVARLLGHGGICLFTAPAAEWAERFRKPSERAQAEFKTAFDATVLVPSWIPSADQQKIMIAEAGLRVIDIESLSAKHLKGVLSPKLLVDEAAIDLPIVRGLAVERT
jgi:SAM-dependent methyltransferase